MANERNSNQRRPARPEERRRSAGRQQPRRQQSRRRRVKKPTVDLSRLLSFRAKAEFRPDSEGSGLLSKLHMTQVQQYTYLKWGGYIGVMVLLLMIQDVIMSQVSIFGGTTDLAVCAILLITVMEGTNVGSLFVLIASSLYYFAGTAPGPYCVGLLTVLGIGATMFRQLYWHRNRGSIVLCTGLALMLYEIGVFAIGIFTNLTRWDRMDNFLVTGGLSWLVLIPLYSLINAIGQIGGNTWKE